jgi:hypothetical protein
MNALPHFDRDNDHGPLPSAVAELGPAATGCLAGTHS